jgi:hypothetical protein
MPNVIYGQLYGIKANPITAIDLQIEKGRRDPARFYVN